MVGRLGPVGSVGAVFAKAAHFPGFREEMADPLLVDMAIHHFDAVRYLLGREPVAVYCEGSNPRGAGTRGTPTPSRCSRWTAATRFVYDGTWCSPGAETSWNASWRVNGEHGTALWDGDDDPTLVGVAADDLDVPDVGLEIDGALREFVSALRTGRSSVGGGARERSEPGHGRGRRGVLAHRPAHPAGRRPRAPHTRPPCATSSGPTSATGSRLAFGAGRTPSVVTARSLR